MLDLTQLAAPTSHLPARRIATGRFVDSVSTVPTGCWVNQGRAWSTRRDHPAQLCSSRHILSLSVWQSFTTRLSEPSFPISLHSSQCDGSGRPGAATARQPLKLECCVAPGTSDAAYESLLTLACRSPGWRRSSDSRVFLPSQQGSAAHTPPSELTMAGGSTRIAARPLTRSRP